MARIIVAIVLFVPHQTTIPQISTNDISAGAVAARVVEHPENKAIQDLPPPTTVPSWAQCPQWWETAKNAGWDDPQMPTLDYVMHRESGCDPNAYNRSGAKGLTQLLGWSCPPNGCFDPWSNLSKAHSLWEQSGWRPWCLAGDPVTGHC